LPEEVATNQFAREPYVLQQLRQYDELLLDLKLADTVFPTFEKTETATAYLLILEGPREYINLFQFIKYSLLYTAIGFAGYYVYLGYLNVSSYF
jgi:hypothetical protein